MNEWPVLLRQVRSDGRLECLFVGLAVPESGTDFCVLLVTWQDTFVRRVSAFVTAGFSFAACWRYAGNGSHRFQ